MQDGGISGTLMRLGATKTATTEKPVDLNKLAMKHANAGRKNRMLKISTKKGVRKTY